MAPFVLLLTRYQLSAWSLHGARYPRTPSFHRLESIRPQAFVAEIDRWELNRPRPIGFSPSHSTTVELSPDRRVQLERMAPKKDSKPSVPIQPVPEKRGYEFFGPYVTLLLSPSFQLGY